jgi:hypothetical protein
MPKAVKDRPKDEHIFPASKIEPLVLTWKKLTQQNRQREAMQVLETIVVDSTEMFKRLAQHEKFHHTVPLDALVVAAQEKIPKWLDKWDPAKGSLFSWMSTCAKNVFRSELVKTTTFTKRIHCTNDDQALERLSGFAEDGQESKDRADAIMAKLHNMTCPWASDEMRGAIRYIIECILQDEHSRQNCIRGAAFAWGTSLDMSKFLYSWTHTQMRFELYSDKQLSYTEQDIFRACQRFTLGPQLLDIFGWQAMKMVIAVCGGQRWKIPTAAELDRMVQYSRMVCEVESTDKDPESIALVARRYGKCKSEKTATDLYDQMTRILSPAMSGEFQVYDDQSTHQDGEEDES